jgi:hypothetical protein
MHADFQELLAIRDGAPLDVAIEEHVASCAHCSFELTRLARVKHDLRQLPQFEPPAGMWKAIRDGLGAFPPSRAPRRLSLIAASGLAAALAVALFVRLEGGHPRPDPAAGVSSTAGTRAGASTDPGAAARAESLGVLITRSQRLEALLRTLPPRPGVERGATSATIDALQARIQLVDLQLSSAPRGDADQARRLWSARVELLNSLVNVRYAEATRTGRGFQDPSEFGVI